MEQTDPGNKEGFITVYVSTDEAEIPKKIHPGEWQVNALKEELGIAEQLLLVEIADRPITHEDGGKLHVYENEKFMGQSRGGGTS